MKPLIICFTLIIMTFTSGLSALDNLQFFGKEYFNNSRCSRMSYDRNNDIIYLIVVNTNNDPYHYGISYYQNNNWNALDFDKTEYPIKDIYQIKDIVQDKTGKLWISTEEGVLSYDISSGWDFFTISLPSGKDIIFNYLLTDSSGNTWFHCTIGQKSYDIFVGMEERLYKINNSQLELIFYADTNDVKNGIRAFSSPPGTSRGTDPDGNFWIAYPQISEGFGLVKVNTQNQEIEFFQLRDYFSDISQKILYPYDIDFISNGRLLISYTANVQQDSRGGISCFNPSDSSWKHYDESDGLFSENSAIINRIENTVVDDFGNFWIGTRDWGIIKFDPNNKTSEVLDLREYFNKPTLFFLNSIYDSFKDKHGNLWFSTGDGIVKAIPEPTGVDYQNPKQNNFEAYPNPVKASKEITYLIRNTPLINGELKIFDLNGCNVKTLNVMSGVERILFNTVQLIPGIYIAKYNSELISFVVTN